MKNENMINKEHCCCYFGVIVVVVACFILIVYILYGLRLQFTIYSFFLQTTQYINILINEIRISY